MKKLYILFLLLFTNQPLFSDPVFNPESGNYYERIEPTGSSFDWYDVKALAESRQYRGYIGHLATVTSLNENSFVKNTVLNNCSASGYFLGGYQLAGSPEPSGGWHWTTGENWGFTYWASGEPCGYQVQDSLVIYGNHANYGRWNDTYILGKSTNLGYIVEYDVSGPSSDPIGFYIAGAYANPSVNYGQTGAIGGFSTHYEDALDENYGKVINKTSSLGTGNMTINTGQNYSWQPGEMSMHSQAAFLDCPIVFSNSANPEQGWEPAWLGRDNDGEEIKRSRNLSTEVKGQFIINENYSDIRLRLTAAGYIDSFTIADLIFFGDTAKSSFEATRWVIAGKAATGLSALAGMLASGTIELLFDPVSEYLASSCCGKINLES